MVDIASASNVSSQIPVIANTNQENAALAKETTSKPTKIEPIESQDVQSNAGPNLGQKIDIRV